MKIGIIGCGNISGIYLDNAKILKGIEVAAVADLNMDVARAKAAEYGVKALTVEQLLADKDISLVLNLTIPKAHISVATAALNAGKHVYSEKPLGVTFADAEKLMALAKAKNLRVGCAPDTFLGSGIQTCRQLIDEGAIGQPVAAAAYMMCHGHESWHPSPEFYYEVGGGPMLDMGPYYVTAMLNLLGPARRISGSARISFPERLITSEPKSGKKVKVETPTHLSGVIDFENGAVATLVTSFDVWSHDHAPLEIYGSEGTLSVPDPNTFGGPVKLRKAGEEAWTEIALKRPYAENSRGLGVADMALGIEEKRPHRASGELALHALEIMQSVLDSSAQGKHIDLKTRCQRPEPLNGL